MCLVRTLSNFSTLLIYHVGQMHYDVKFDPVLCNQAGIVLASIIFVGFNFFLLTLFIN